MRWVPDVSVVRYRTMIDWNIQSECVRCWWRTSRTPWHDTLKVFTSKFTTFELKRNVSTFFFHCSRTLEIPYFSIVYQYYDGQLFSHCKPVVDSISRTLRTCSLTEEKAISIALEAAGEAPRSTVSEQENAEKEPKLTMGTALFELYLCLQQFHK